MSPGTVELGDAELLAEVGRRLRAYRLQQNLTIEAVAERAGLGALTVLKAEGGGNFTLTTLIRVLRALGRLEQLDSFLPEPPLSPLVLLESRGRPPRRRARRRGHD
jgi:transcriptional regulator with XRE-family HTH domain